MDTIQMMSDNSGLSHKLISAVLEKLGIYELDHTEQDHCTLEDIANHGISGGYAGFTYNSDTIDFWNKNRIEIRKALVNMDDSLGEDLLSMIQGFNCLKDLDLTQDQIARAIYTDEETEDRTAILNALAWFAAEEVARAYQDLKESEG